ncbi:MAG: hypothetical protein HY320_00880 [Armatimonadetes bacterium]|nr:hypothetical protein [Armatimonadota bacterium]
MTRASQDANPTARRAPAREWFLAALFFALLATALHARALFSSATYYFGDLGDQHLPLHLTVRRMISAGQWPLWSPGIFGGYPIFAEGQVGACYPLNFLLHLGKLPAAFALEGTLWLHSWLAGLFTYGLARRCQRSSAASLLAGVLFASSGYLTARIIHLPVFRAAIWLPLELALLESARTASGRPRARWLLLLTLTIGVQATAFHPPQTFYSLAALLIAALAAGWGRSSGTTRSGIAAWVAIPAVIGAGLCLAAAQLLPTWELYRHSARAMVGGYDYLTQFSLPILQSPTLILPNLFGSPATGDYWGAPNYWELNGFIGALPLLLAALGARQAWRDPAGRAFVLLAGVGFALALGKDNPVYHLLLALPGFNLFKAPSRWLLLFTVGVVGLAAYGVDRLRSTPPRWASRAAVGVAVLGLVAVLLLAVTRPAVRSLAGSILERRDARAVPTQSGLGPREPDYYRQQLRRRLDPYLNRRLADFGWLALLGVGAAFALRQRVSPTTRLAALAGLATADLFRFGFGYQPLIAPDYHTRPAALTAAIHADGARGRIWLDGFSNWEMALTAGRSGWSGGAEVAWARREALPWSMALTQRLAVGHGGAPLPPHRWAGLVGAIQRAIQPAPVVRELTGQATQPPQSVARTLGKLGFAYVISPRNLTPFGFLPLARAAGLTLYRNPEARPRAYLASHWESASTEAESLSHLMGIAEAVIEAPIPPPASTPPAITDSVRWLRDEPAHVVLAIRAEGPRWLVLTDRFFPGWFATVDGAPTPIWRANYWARAVHLPPGEHVVAFNYQPHSVRVGLFLSLTSLAGVLAALITTLLTSAPSLPRKPG